jgi:hypothetical protein
VAITIRLNTLVVLATGLVPSFLGAQIVFERYYGGPTDDLGLCVVQTADGGYATAGVTESFGAGGYDFYLVKTDSHGDTLWTRTFGGPHDDVGWSVRQTTDGGYIVVGGTDTSGSGSSDIRLIKADANGDTLWTRTYGGPLADVEQSAEQTADGGYIITGWTTSFGTGGDDVWVIKTDATGDTLWTRAYGGASNDEGNSVVQSTDGGYIIAASTRSFGAGSQDVWLIKTDSMGDTLWTRTFGGDSIDYGGSVQQTADGGYIVAGWTFSYSDAPLFYLIKTDAVGDTLWTKTIGGPGWTEGSSCTQVRDGGYIIAGSCGVGLPDVYLVRTDANGDTLWTRVFGGPDFDGGYSVRQTEDGGYVVAGQTYSFGAGLSDFYLIKTDADGSVTVTEPKASPTRASSLSLTCEPNPCRGRTAVSLKPQTSSSKPLTLRMYDSQGRVVLTRQVSTSPFPLSTSNLPSGAYFLRLDAGNEHANARLILQH